MKKSHTIWFTAFASLLLALSVTTGANAKSKVKVKGYTLYKTKITKISENEYHDWVVKGTTKAPNKTKIMATPISRKNLNYGETSAESKKGASWAKVKNHKFTAAISPVSTTATVKEHPGQKTKTQIFAIKNYHKKWTNASVPKKVVKKVKSNFTPINLVLSESQANYDNNLGKKSSDSSSSTSSHESTATKFENKLNKLNKGSAQSAEYDPASKTVTWTGYDDWKTWSDSDLQKTMDILQTITYQTATKYDLQNVLIVVQTEDGTVIARNTNQDMDLQFAR